MEILLGLAFFLLIRPFIFGGHSSSDSDNEKDDFDRDIEEYIMYDEIFDDEDDF